MKVKCKGCGNILIDTETSESNFVVYRELDVKFTEGLKAEVYFGDYYIICKTCGRMVKLSIIESLGIEIDTSDYVVIPPKVGDEHEWQYVS